MTQKYSQFSAFLALVKASVRSMMKSPSSVVFAIGFPLVFILVFGFIGDRQDPIKVGITAQSAVNNEVFLGLAQNKELALHLETSDNDIYESFGKGNLDAIIEILPAKDSLSPNVLTITTTEKNVLLGDKLNQSINRDIIDGDAHIKALIDRKVIVNKATSNDRQFKLIDFILPGQLGFSLLAASVFGTAFVFFNMRQLLVLKRFFATPIRKSVILLSEGTARLIFQLAGAGLIILIGKVFFDYTLVKGWVTVVNMLAVSALGLLVFMSFGFIISGIAKSDSVIPPLANIFVMPQFLLAGTFFGLETLPTWLQFLAKLMPLTYFNSALRAIAFDGASLWTVRFDILVMVIWGVIGYALAAKLFKWE